MTSPLGFQVQQNVAPQWLKDDIQRSGAKYVKLINADAFDPYPFGEGVTYIGRLHFGKDEPDKQLIYQGAAGADQYWAMCCPRIEKAPWVGLWEGPNEPVIDDEAKAHAFVSFTRRRIQLWHDAGLGSLDGVFSTGNPLLSLWRILGMALDETNGLVLHEYGMRKMTWDGWHLGRYRKVIAALREAGHRVPPIFITETGIDYAGRPDLDGWRAQGFSEDEYLAQIVTCDREWQQDREIECVTPFMWLDDGWPSFDIPRSLSSKYAAYLGSVNMSVEEEIMQLAHRHVIPLNPESAFEIAGAQRGYLPASLEFDYEKYGTRWRGQTYRHPEIRGSLFTVYCQVGDWGNLKWIEHRN